MDQHASSKMEPPSRELKSQLDQLCRDFDAAWNSGNPPAVESYLQKAPVAMRSRLLAELLRIEIAHRRRSGEQPTPQEFRLRFPADGAVIDALFLDTPTEAFPGPMALPSTVSAAAESSAPAGAGWPEIPGYEILAQLAPGGMGLVYRARQLGLNRLVAVKVIRSGAHADAHERARFRVEAEAVASLSHPHIIQIYDYGEWNGMPYIAMEFAEGGSLAQRLHGGPLPPRQAAELVETLAHALQYVHSHGVIHRDLKPANVLHPENAVPKLADFGLAKRLDQDQGLTQTQAVLGTASYMAPEQAGGDKQAIGPATDVYALGAILYELLTGRPPFRAETRELTIHQVLSEDPLPPIKLRPDVPPELEAICLKCLEKEFAHRFDTASAVAADLRRFLNEEPISIQSFGDLDRHARAARRHGYEVLERRGSGRLGIVYKARQVALKRTVALEMIAVPPVADAAWLERLRAEAETAAQLHHPNIAELYDFGDLNGEPFIAREYVEAASLSDRIAGPPAPAEQIVALMETLARAVHEAHLHGIIHGNLKPSKVLVAADDVMKITRFGLTGALRTARVAKEADSDAGYVAPEQAREFAQPLEPSADTYALGAILHALLTGRPPAPGTDGRIAGPRLLRPEVPRELEAICLKCLEPQAAGRYPNAAAVAEDLRRFAAGEVLFVDDLDDWAQQQRWARRAGYEILELLGQGESGFTYKARRVASDSLVVLKRIAARHRFVPLMKERFRLEARLLGRVRHPNIVRLYDHGEQNDLTYYAREFVEGKSLAEFAAECLRSQPPRGSSEKRSGRASLRRAVKIVYLLTRAVGALHDTGFVHGALHPGNVYVTPASAPKITGFRRLRLSGATADAAHPEGEVRRFASYLAPEQLEARRRSLGPACDIYALGALLYTLLSGQPPFVCQTLEQTLEQIRSQEPLPPRERQARIPRRLEQVCLSCLKKRAEERPASAARFAESLRTAIRRPH